MNTMNIKNILLISLASVGGVISSLLGGWDKLLKGLCICMVIDFLTGLILAFIFHKSQKTQNGAISDQINKNPPKKMYASKKVNSFWNEIQKLLTFYISLDKIYI